MMKFNMLFVCLVISASTFAQDDMWEVYIAQYDEGAGSTTVNMSLVENAHKSTLPFVIITGVTTSECTVDGFPMKSEFQYLYKIEDEVDSIIRSNTKLELAGTFTYQCERLSYFYVADTSRIRSQLTKFYQENYSRYKFYVNIKLDNNWDGYLKFLYPNEETREFISNNRVIEQLQLAGDNLTNKRQVDHWVYFQTAASRKLFAEYAVSQGFNVEGEEEIEDPLFSFQLRISREDLVNVKSISEITLTLRKKAKEMNGDYDGWETVVVIEE